MLEREWSAHGSAANRAGATFREAISMGVFDGSLSEARQIAFSLRPDFNGDDYNLLTKCVLLTASVRCESPRSPILTLSHPHWQELQHIRGRAVPAARGQADPGVRQPRGVPRLLPVVPSAVRLDGAGSRRRPQCR
jgi:hypothetical protein